MDSRQRTTIIKLQSLNPHSIEYYNEATKFFRVRSRLIQSCGLCFFFFGLIGIMGIFAPWETWRGHLTGVFVTLFSAFFGWVAFRMGHTQIVLIKTSRVAGQKHQENAIRFFCERIYCTEPIGVFILRQLGDTDAQATLNPIVKNKLKKKLKTEEEYKQQIENKEKVLREKVNRELQTLFPNSK